MKNLPEFNVVQFFENGTCEYVRRNVDVGEALKAVRHYCHSVAAQMGVVDRVIVTDGGDFCCFEWQRDKGVTFPAEHLGRWKPEVFRGSQSRPN